MAHIARKRFGQHFLTDGGVVDAIVRAIAPKPGEALVEIGPGLGALTQPVLERCGALTVIELDRDLARRWRERAGVSVIEADALTVDFAALADAASAAAASAGVAGAAGADVKLRVIGNLPYNISTPMLFHLLAVAHRVRDQHFMLQKEVVARMAARPGNTDFGRLTVMLQWRYSIESLFDVAPTAFDPPPRVQSAIVRMRPLASPPVLDEAQLGALVMLAFSQRRKLLRHTLGRWLDEHGFGGQFDVQRRAEEVPVAEYVALAQAVSAGRAAAAGPVGPATSRSA